MRIVSGKSAPLPEIDDDARIVLDPKNDTWLLDHCPTWTRPALPMMSMVDYLAQHVSDSLPAGTVVPGLRDLRTKGLLHPKKVGQGNPQAAQ